MIKLSKVGKTNKKMFRLIISEKGRDPFGKVLEILGSYNPYTKELVAKEDRIKYWLGNGAQMTPTVNNLLVGKKVVDGEKVTASKPGKKSEKRTAQIQAKAEKKSSTEASPEAEQAKENSAESPEAPKEEKPEEVKEEVKEEAENKEVEEKTAEETSKEEEKKA